MEIKVEKGDTLSQIALDLRRRGVSVTWEELARANNITDPRKMRSGITLKVPGTAEEARNEVRMPAEPQGPSLVAQGIQQRAGRGMPSAGEAVSNINFSNPFNQQSIQPSFDAAQGFAQSVLGGAAPGMVAGLIPQLAKLGPMMQGAGKVPNLRGPGQVAEPGSRMTLGNGVPGTAPAFGNVAPPANPGAANAGAVRQYLEGKQALEGMRAQQFAPQLLTGRGSNMYAGQSRQAPDLSTMPGQTYAGRPVSLDALHNIIYGGLR
jgi:LysM repeat protein